MDKRRTPAYERWMTEPSLSPVRADLDAVFAWIAAAAPQRRTEVVPIGAALGRRAAADVHALVSAPAVPTALRDGFAVRSADVADARPDAPVLVERFTPVQGGEPAPDWADAVAPLSACRIEPAGLWVLDPPPPGALIAPTAACVRAGARIVPRGVILEPDHLAMLRLVGVGRVAVYSGAKVALQPVDGGEDCALLAVDLVRAADGLVLPEDQPLSAKDAGGADLVLLCGSLAESRCPARAALAAAGRVEIAETALRPGGALGFGRVGAVPVAMLPADPGDAFWAWIVAARNLLRPAGGASSLVELAGRITSPLGVTEAVPVRLDGDFAMPIPRAPGGALGEALRADGYILIPASCDGKAAGVQIRVFPLSGGLP